MNHTSKCHTVCRLVLNFTFSKSRKCKVWHWVEYVSCLQYFIKPILFSALLWAYCALLLFLIKFRTVFHVSTEEKELFPALNPLMLYCMLKSSQILDVWRILREVLRTLREKHQDKNTIPFLHLHLCHVRLLWACWLTYSSSFPSTQINPPEPLKKWVTSTLSYEFSLLKQKILCPSLLKRLSVMKCLISWDFIAQTWLAGAGRRGHNDFTSETRQTRSAMLPLWEKHTQNTKNAHIHIYVSLCCCVLIHVPIWVTQP